MIEKAHGSLDPTLPFGNSGMDDANFYFYYAV